MKSLAGLFALFIALFSVPNSAYSRGVCRSYTVVDGLAGGNIRAIVQDTSGDLWIATDGDGVSRYDGEDFRTFSREDGLASNFVRAILEDRKGNLWFATETGVSRYDGKSFGATLSVKDGLVDNLVTSITEDREGNLWFGTQGGVSKYDGETFENFTIRNGLVDDYVRAILEDSANNLWFGTRGGVSKYDGETFENFTTENGLIHNYVGAILEDNGGDLWFGTSKSGISRYDGNRFENFTTENGLADDKIRALLKDSKGNLWFGTVGGVNRYDGKTFETFTSKDGLVGNFVSAICEDREGSLWFGTWGYGISKHDNKIQHYLEDKTIQYVVEDSNGNIWFAAHGGSILRYDGKTFQDFTAKVGLARLSSISDEAPAILEGRNGDLWFTGLGGITKYNGTKSQTIEDIGLKDMLVEPIFKDSQGNIWFSVWNDNTTTKIAGYDGKRFLYLDLPVKGDIFPSDAGDEKVLEDKEGNIWFVTERSGIYRYDGKGLAHFTTDDGLAGVRISSVAADRAGNLWFGIRDNDGPDAKGIGGLSMYSGEFSAESEHQTDLNRGNIPEGLREAFKDNGFLLPQDAGVIVKEAGQRWLIRELLFSVGARLGSGLNDESVSEDLKQAFSENGNALSQSIGVSIGTQMENYWLIADIVNSQAYAVWESGDKLNIYDNRQTYVVRNDSDKLNISRFLTYSTKDGLGNDSVTGILGDGDGNLWFRTYHGGVSKYDGKSFEKFTTREGVSNTIRSMLKDNDGDLWFGSQGEGVSQYDGEHFQTLTTVDGLLNDTAFVALADSRENIWLRYGVPGLTRYTPCKDVLPRVVITQVIADKKSQASIQPVSVPSKTRVVFRYRGLTLNQFGNILYDYRLKGYNETWAPTRERAKEYENLSPGTYEFQVRAIDRDLNYSHPQTQKLIVRPPFYMRSKYIILFAVATFALCLLTYEFFSHRRTAVRLKEELRQRNEELRQRDELERKRITKELQDAHDMQMNLMSEPPPTLAEFDIYGDCRPAREVGGDFFRCIWLGEAKERFAIALGDVSGKGMKAAWTAAMADGMLHAEAKLWWFSTGQILSELNRGLYERKTDEITYVVFCFASVNIREKTLQFSNSGLPWPLMNSEGELITIAESSGFPLGMMGDSVYGERNITLKAGDTIVFYTDGITEAMNQRDEMYTPERLENMLGKADPELSAQQLVDEIFEDVHKFTGGATQYDDMTIVVLKVNGREEVI